MANAYLTVLLADQTAQAALLQLHLSQNQLELTHKQVVAGTLPELNAAELESQVAQDSATYITDKSNVVQDILQLKAYMDLDAATPFEIDTPPVDQVPIEQLADLQHRRGLCPRADALAPAKDGCAADPVLSADGAGDKKGAMFPVVSLYGNLSSYYLNTPGEAAVPYSSFFTDTVGHVVGSGTPVTNPEPLYKIVDTKAPGYFSQLNNYFAQAVGVNVIIPILNGGILRTNYAKSKLNLRNQELQRDQDNLTLKNNIYQAYTLAVAALEENSKLRRSPLAATTKKVSIMPQKRYNVGMSNTIDLLTNQNNFFNAKVNLLYDQYDYVFKDEGTGITIKKDGYKWGYKKE